ncbi:hypothetical protein [Spirosoma aerophilum]
MKTLSRFQLPSKKTVKSRMVSPQKTTGTKNAVGCGATGGTIVSTVM